MPEATYQDIVDLPEHLTGEILAGELHIRPGPTAWQGYATLGLLVDLGGPFMRGRSGPGGWWLLSRSELHLGEDVLVPSLAGWRRARMPVVPDVAGFTLVPDWICEVLSPRTHRTDRLVKMPRYARHGVNHAWLIDPITRTLEVYRRHEDNWLYLGGHSDADVVRAEPFDAVPLELSGLWPAEVVAERV